MTRKLRNIRHCRRMRHLHAMVATNVPEKSLAPKASGMYWHAAFAQLIGRAPFAE